MGHTNSTPNYNLPQFLTTDKPAWLTDINGAFSAIDTGIDAAKDAADAAQGDATQALTDAGNASTAASTADAKGSGAVASIAPVFDAASTYGVGQLVMYNNLLYICTYPVTTPGAWSGISNWNRIVIEDIANNIFKIFASPYNPSNTYVIGNTCTYNEKYWRCTAPTSGTFNPSHWEDVTVGQIIGGRQAALSVRDFTFSNLNNSGNTYSINVQSSFASYIGASGVYAITISGWSGIGNVFSIGYEGDTLKLMFPYGHTFSNATLTVRVCYTAA